uniref:Zinc knuckle CX2CX4HX4C domain-containing protein n=1 Tax=Cannabis sativa TaxID=3483 RepID=A0A803Q9H0_CANSA
MEGSPWTFDRVPLIFERLKIGENPRLVVLNKLEFWVQIHNLTTGFMSERVVRDLGNFVGTFVKSDPNNFIGVWRDYLWVRIKLDITRPLRRKKKLEKQGSVVCYAHFKYEDLPTFCFICGILGHSDRSFERLFDTPRDQIKNLFSLEMKALPRRKNYAIGAKWLRSGATNKNGGAAFSNSPVNEDHNNHGGETSHGSSQSMHNHLGISITKNQGLSFPQPRIEDSNEGCVGGGINSQAGKLTNQKSLEVLGKSPINEDNVETTQVNGDDALLELDNKRRRMGLGKSNGPEEDSNMGYGGSFNKDQDGLSVMDDVEMGVEVAQGSAGGLALLWRNQEDGHILGYSKNHIDFLVKSSEKGHWRLTGVYGEPIRARRHQTWELLRFLARDSNLP